MTRNTRSLHKPSLQGAETGALPEALAGLRPSSQCLVPGGRNRSLASHDISVQEEDSHADGGKSEGRGNGDIKS